MGFVEGELFVKDGQEASSCGELQYLYTRWSLFPLIDTILANTYYVDSVISVLEGSHLRSQLMSLLKLLQALTIVRCGSSAMVRNGQS